MKKRKLKQETIDAIMQMTPMDDMMFAYIYNNNIPAMNELIRVCLKDESISVEEVLIHKEEMVFEGHKVIFDAKVVDGKGRRFVIEVQKDNRGAIIERARYYASVLDTKALNPGEDYSKIRPVFVIFITKSDYWGKGLDQIEVCSYSKQLGHAIEDGRHIFYINGAARGESDIAHMMHDFRCSDPESMYYNEIKRSRDRLNNNREDLEKMGYNYEDIIEKGIEKGIEQGIERGIKQGIAQNSHETATKMKAEYLPVDVISRCTGLTAEEIAKL
ncbi:MAG: PD-(D/E)XK nuclease family transposase [Sphaerochaetaceae bacterium]|nr:PD-(D/E)XK nuclease family transposase [Sphaerochaetaceae bacterium]